MKDRPYPKVLHLIASLAIGGTERQLVEFIQRSAEPLRHHVALFYEVGPLATDLSNEPILLGHLSRRVRDVSTNLRTVRALRRTILESSFDLVHAHLGLSELLAAVGTPRRVPIVASRRGRNVGFESNWALRLAEGFGHRRTRILICNANAWAEDARRRDMWSPPTRVIPNAVDLERFSVAAMPGGPPTVAVVANFHPYKGHARFLRAFAVVREGMPEARAILIGDGAGRTLMEGLVSDLGIVGSVTFAGRVEDVRPLVRGAHAVALTSDHEGFPNALLEAMAMGRPIVATRVGGVPELVRDGKDGFLTTSDPNQIAERLTSLLRDQALGDRLGRSARARAESFGWDRLVRDTEAVYGDVLRRS